MALEANAKARWPRRVTGLRTYFGSTLFLIAGTALFTARSRTFYACSLASIKFVFVTNTASTAMVSTLLPMIDDGCRPPG